MHVESNNHNLIEDSAQKTIRLLFVQLFLKAMHIDVPFQGDVYTNISDIFDVYYVNYI